MTLPVGPGVSDVTLADVDGDGLADIVVTNKTHRRGGRPAQPGRRDFAPPVLYRAGGGLVRGDHTGDPATLTTLEATAGVAVGAFTREDLPDLVAIDPGSNTFSVLTGWAAAGSPTRSLPDGQPGHRGPRRRHQGNGVPDVIILERPAA